MELLTLWIWNHEWAIPAICDAVALTCAVGTVALLKHPSVAQTETKTAVVKQVTPDAAMTPLPVPTQNRGVKTSSRLHISKTSQSSRISDDMLASLPVSKSVTKALAALDRWETTYRPRSRGLDQLTALAARGRNLPAVHKVNE